MRKFALFCSALCLSATMFAQSTPQPQRLVSEVNFATPKPGMTGKYLFLRRWSLAWPRIISRSGWTARYL